VWYLIVAYLVYGAGAGLVSARLPTPHSRACPRPSRCRGSDRLHLSPDWRGPRVAVTGVIIATSSAGFVHASHAAWAMVAGCGVMVVVLGLVSTGRWALATAERNGARLATDMSPVPEGAR